MIETETIKPAEFTDPSEPPPFQPTHHEPMELGEKYGLPPLSPAREWLFENRRLDMKSFVDFTPFGPVVREGMERQYPGMAEKITRAHKAGYSDQLIMLNIEDKVDRALKAGYTDGMIEKNLYYGYQDEGFLERPFGSYFYGRPENLLEKMWDYLGTTPDYNTDPIKHELRAVAERGISSFTLGLSDAFQEEVAMPRTVPGTIAGSVASLIGFIKGPLKMSKDLVGGRLAPTATGLRGVTQICTQGGATLGLAGFLSSAVPAFVESESETEACVEIVENTATMGLVGFLYPLAGVIPTKPLRLAVGMAAFDKIRAGRGQWSTIDDVIIGVKDGTISSEELAERSFGYLLNLYFLNKVPSMKAQLAGLEKNAMIRKMLECNPEETEAVILQLRKGNLIPRDPKRFLEGVGKWDKMVAFGSEKEFNNAYRAIFNEQVNLAARIRADITGKGAIRIPKELQPLAQQARIFTKAINFEQAVKAKAKLTETETNALQDTVKGDLKRFWKGVQERDYLEKQSMIQHKSQAEKILDAIKVEAMFNKGDTELQRLNSGKLRKTYQAAARALWDTSANIKRDLLKKGGALGKEAVIRHDLIRGSMSKSIRILNEAHDKIYKDLSKSDEVTLNRIIQSRRTIAIDKYKPEMKHPGGLGLKEHQGYLDSIPKETFMRLNERANAYFSEMNSQVNQLLKAGIISRESAAGLLSKGDYSPRNFIQHIDPERTYTFGGKKISVWDSGIKALDEGSYKTLENNSRCLLNQVITRTQARIFRNEANRALYNLAKDMPENGVVKLSAIVKVDKKGKPVFQKTPAGYERLGVMVGGQMREMLMPSDMAREWITQDPAVSTQYANIIGWATGAKILRPMATGLNPEFAITNLPRDIAHAWATTYEYSPHLPIATAQMGKDYVKVAKDTFTRQGRWLDYLNEGGGMEFLTHQGRVTGKTTGVWSGLQKALGYLGETSEIWTRLALRERAIVNGKPPHEATWEARNYLDFSQGGNLIKGLDTAIPYLNAGVQGTRGLVRAAKQKPGTFIYKMAEVGTLATGLYLANRKTNPDCWESISDYEKSNNFIVTMPLTSVDEEGNTRHWYFRVAKDQGQKLVCTLFENLMAKHLGEDIDVEQAKMAVKELISITPTELLPPALDAALGYMSNEDFWRNEDIWKGPEVEAKEEYRARTHPAFVKWGELTSLSPERSRYALQQYFTGGNIYTAAVGAGLRRIMDKLPEDVREQTVQDMMRQAPFLRRVLRATDPYTQYRKEVETAKIEETTRKYIQTRTLDALSEQYYAGEIEQEQVKSFIATQTWQDRQRLVERHQRFGRLRDIPDKRWWLNLIGADPEVAATLYWTRWSQADKTEKKRLDQYMRKVPGIVTERFMLRLNQLKAK